MGSNQGYLLRCFLFYLRLKVLNDTKLFLNEHLESIWYIQNLQTSPIPQTSFLVGTFLAVSYSITALFSMIPFYAKSHRSMYVTRFIFDILFQIVSLTELMAGVKASTKTYQLFQITQFPFPVLLKNMGN